MKPIFLILIFVCPLFNIKSFGQGRLLDLPCFHIGSTSLAKNGGMMVASRRYHYPDFYDTASMLRLDREGRVLWTSSFQFGGTPEAHVTEYTLKSDTLRDRYYHLSMNGGPGPFTPTSGYYQKFAVVALNGSGQLVWKHQYQGFPGISIRDFVIDPSTGDIYCTAMAGTWDFVGGDYGRPTIFKLSGATGQVLWSQQQPRERDPRFPGQYLRQEGDGLRVGVFPTGELIYTSVYFNVYDPLFFVWRLSRLDPSTGQVVGQSWAYKLFNGGPSTVASPLQFTNVPGGLMTVAVCQIPC